MRPSTRQVVHEAGNPDEEQEKQEHEVEHQQGVQGHQLHRARATCFTITRVHPRTYPFATSFSPSLSIYLSIQFCFSLSLSLYTITPGSSMFSRSLRRNFSRASTLRNFDESDFTACERSDRRVSGNTIPGPTLHATLSPVSTLSSSFSRLMGTRYIRTHVLAKFTLVTRRVCAIMICRVLCACGQSTVFRFD